MADASTQHSDRDADDPLYSSLEENDAYHEGFTVQNNSERPAVNIFEGVHEPDPDDTYVLHRRDTVTTETLAYDILGTEAVDNNAAQEAAMDILNSMARQELREQGLIDDETTGIGFYKTLKEHSDELSDKFQDLRSATREEKYDDIIDYALGDGTDLSAQDIFDTDSSYVEALSVAIDTANDPETDVEIARYIQEDTDPGSFYPFNIDNFEAVSADIEDMYVDIRMLLHTATDQAEQQEQDDAAGKQDKDRMQESLGRADQLLDRVRAALDAYQDRRHMTWLEARSLEDTVRRRIDASDETDGIYSFASTRDELVEDLWEAQDRIDSLDNYAVELQNEVEQVREELQEPASLDIELTPGRYGTVLGTVVGGIMFAASGGDPGAGATGFAAGFGTGAAAQYRRDTGE